jgi:hypothetical protein
VHGERHLDERRRAGEVFPPDGERKDGHREGDEPRKDEKGGAAAGRDGGEDAVGCACV